MVPPSPHCSLRRLTAASLGGLVAVSQLLVAVHPATADDVPDIDQTETCDLLIVGGGLSGSAAAYESLKLGRTVCMSELTDWVGGQISSQGTSALDEARMQRSLLFYPAGYNALRQMIADKYGQQNPGDCWVSAACFLPYDAHDLLTEMLEDAADEGDGTLKWFPSTVIKDLTLNEGGTQIESAIAIQHAPQPDTPPLNHEPLSQIIEDVYEYEDSKRLAKTVIQFVPQQQSEAGADWYVIEATETGELIALADVPYRVGLDPRSYLNPSSASDTGDPYCTQGFTYTFAMEQTEEPQENIEPEFYERYRPYYGYDPNPNISDFDVVF
ncbi:MAG: FAD-dependent oxidoreductase, partial [Cyanobacteria bacterium P01_A01_bin.135]